MNKRILLALLLLVSQLSPAQIMRNYLRPKGNDYPLPQQAAKAVVNWRIFPRFALPTHDVLYWGPRFRKSPGAPGEWDDDALRHGYSQMAPQFFYQTTGNSEDARDLGLDGQKMFAVFYMPGSPANMPDAFKNAYNSLPSSDARKTEIGKYINSLIPTANTEAAKLMGRWIGGVLKNDICGGKIPKYISIDEESAHYWDAGGETVMRTFLGNLYLGALEVCEGSKVFTYGQKVAPNTMSYKGHADQGRVIGGKLWYENREFLNNMYWKGFSEIAAVDVNSPIAQALRANGGGIASGDHYWKNTIGQGTIYQKNGDGSYKLVNGRRILREDNSQVTLYGKTFTVYGKDPNFYNENEYDWWTSWLYEDVQFDDAHRWWLNGGQYPLRKNDRRAEFANIKTGDWYRVHTEEANAPGQGDSRPLNPEGLEAGMLFRYLLHDADLMWHSEYLQRGPLSHENRVDFPGQRGGSMGYTSSLGQWEVVTKALHRASEFDHLPWGNHYWIRPIRAISATPDKWNEPIIRGRISETGNYVQLVAAWPILDPEDEVTVNVWWDTGTWKSKSTFFTLKGRAPFIDTYKPDDVPAGVQLLPQHMRVRFTNIYGETFTWAGDYRYTASNSEAMPERVIKDAVTPTPSCMGTLTATVLPVGVGCNTNFSLSVACAGSNCDGVSYSWTGAGLLSSTGETVSAKLSTNGTYFYTATATKANCPAKTITIGQSVTGCGSETVLAYDQTFPSYLAEGPGSIWDKPDAPSGKIKDGALTYTIPNVPGPGSYTLVLNYQSTSTPGTANVSVNGGTPQALSFAGTGGQIKSLTAVVAGFVQNSNTVTITPTAYLASESIRISRPGSATVTPPDNTTIISGLPSINYVYVFGNSFTYAGSFTGWPRSNGMSASSLEMDYVHRLQAMLRTVNPSAQVYGSSHGAPFEGQTYSYLDGNYDYNSRITGDLNYQFSNNPPAFGAIVISIGENIYEASFDKAKYFAGLDQVISRIPKTSDCRILIRGAFWSGHSTSTAAAQEYATSRGYTFISFSDRVDYPAYRATEFDPPNPNAHSGVAAHWNDAGHLEIAKRIAQGLASITTGTPNVPTTGYGGLYADNSTYVNLPELNRPSATLQFPRAFIINGNTRVAVNTKLGSVIDYMSFDGGLFSAVNSPIWPDNQKDDAGRQLMDAMYGYPRGDVGPNSEGHYTEAGQSTGQFHPAGAGSIGYNPVQGGSTGMNPTYGNTLVLHNSGSRLFYETTPAQWDMAGIFGRMKMKGWIDFDPSNSKVVRRHARWEMDRNDSYSTKYPTPRQQEAPCWYTTTDYKRVFYIAGQPFTNAPLIEYSYNEAMGGIAAPPILGSEPVILMKHRTLDRYIAIISNNARFAVGGFNLENFTSNKPTSFNSNYFAAAPLMSIDKDGVYDFDAAFMEGTEAEIRAYVNSLTRLKAQWNGLPEYIFNSKSRLGFFLHKAEDQLEKNITSYLSVKPLVNTENAGRDYNVSLPERWINGRTVKKIYVRMALTSSDGAMWLRWVKPGLVNSGEFFKEFNVANDGQFHTVEIDMTGMANWDNTDITTFVLRKRNNNTVLTNEELKIKWISYRDLTATNP
ncbi:hypothetical protein GCM10028806_34240 [Spirosoma terrae]|uniref:Ig-like domain-containing protein n=1 Tax=Spirosoma terrae TaxID=1968276 RepID=A0A6L9L8C4_9BACT|nr:hypothetical protein [Spirosoma terrae]NDU95737.1 hypothetical protein [Spirosoma terrae]